MPNAVRGYTVRGVLDFPADGNRVDPDARVVEVWHPGDERPEITTETMRWRLEEKAPALDIPLAPVFEQLAR